jgi:hypothetical protein
MNAGSLSKNTRQNNELKPDLIKSDPPHNSVSHQRSRRTEPATISEQPTNMMIGQRLLA